MRSVVSLVVAVVALAVVPPARAQFPLSLRVSGGMGVGSAHRGGLSGGGLNGLAAADLAWRRGTGRAIVLSFEAAGPIEGHSYVLDPVLDPRTFDGIPQLHPGDFWQESVLIGLERSRSSSGISPYVQGGVGLGRIMPSSRPDDDAFNGLALAGTAGIRVIPRPGPLGFVLGLHTSHVFSSRARHHAIGLILGLAVYPQ